MRSNKVQAILAIVATLLIVGVIVLQSLELSFYSAPNSVWPL
ncbi:MAG TPA: hypothetical protein PKE12_09610 [Kiritimatiellia bacterium]|nr:hypothetical protein [Kiritimatiellia bacterium]